VSVTEGNHTGDILIDGSYDGTIGSRGGCNAVDSSGYCIPGYGFIHFNLSQWGSNSTESFQKWSALHEMGHALGLAHSCNSQAVMFGPYNGCGASYGCYMNSTTCFLQPQQDDINGLNAQYPAQYPNCAATSALPPAAVAVPSPGALLDKIQYDAHQTAAKVLGTHPNLPFKC